MGQINWWLPCVRCSVLGGVSIRVTSTCLARFSARRIRHFSASPQFDSRFTPLHWGVFWDRNGDFYLLGQCQDSTHRRFHRLGVRRINYATRRVSRRQTYRPNTNFPERLYGKKQLCETILMRHSRSKKRKLSWKCPADERGMRIVAGEALNKVDERMKPFEEAYRQRFQDHANKLNRDYKREIERQEQVGETLSRITPTSSLIYLATNLTQTGKRKRGNYFQAGARYYDALHTDLFSKIVDHASARMWNPATDIVKITQPPPLEITTLGETFRQSIVDVLLLCFFAVVLTTVAFLKILPF